MLTHQKQTKTNNNQVYYSVWFYMLRVCQDLAQMVFTSGRSTLWNTCERDPLALKQYLQRVGLLIITTNRRRGHCGAFSDFKRACVMSRCKNNWHRLQLSACYKMSFYLFISLFYTSFLLFSLVIFFNQPRWVNLGFVLWKLRVKLLFFMKTCAAM